MVQIGQLVLSLLPWTPWSVVQDAPLADLSPVKSIAIVGAGSGGLAILKTLLDLPEDTRAGWDIVLYEQRRDVGGVWLPDPPGYHPEPPQLPESPTYPLLHTNTPHPTMTYVNFTFRPMTPLFPTWDYVQQYHADYADHFELWPYIDLNHSVIAAEWRGDSTKGKWAIEVRAKEGDDDHTRIIKRNFDHLIVANGHNHYPHVPTWNGTEDWLANTPLGTPKRDIIHSIYYRDPHKYANRSVIIVGASASGRDASLQVGPLARVAYQSLTPTSSPTPGAKVIPKPRISHFTNDSVVFEDGTELTDVDSLILATGYEFRVPFLSTTPSSALSEEPSTKSNCTTADKLITNLRYIFPLYEHIFSLAPNMPTTALAFVGLPVLIANCPSDIAQSLLISHALANSTLLPPREEMLQKLVAHEDLLRTRGYDPYYVGHRLLGGDTEAQDYQDNLVQYLKDEGVLPQDGKKFVEDWRRMGRTQSQLMYRGWQRAQEQGKADKWLEGRTTQDDWANLLRELAEWQGDWEKEHGQGIDWLV